MSEVPNEIDLPIEAIAANKVSPQIAVDRNLEDYELSLAIDEQKEHVLSLLRSEGVPEDKLDLGFLHVHSNIRVNEQPINYEGDPLADAQKMVDAFFGRFSLPRSESEG